MNKLITRGLALVLAAAALPLAAQPGPGNAAVPRADRPALEALIRHRAELGLSDAQLRRLEEIRAGLEAQNEPLRQQLAAQSERMRAERRAQLERMSAEERRAELRRLRQQRPIDRVPADMQPIVRQMRVNIEEAMHQAQGVLTAEQRLRARELLRAEMRAARRPGLRGERRGVRPGAGRVMPENRQP